MEKKNFFAPLSKGLGATRRAAMLLLVMMLTTATAWAQSTETVNYIDADGNTQTVTATVLTGNEEPSKWGSIDLAAGWYVVKGNISYTNLISDASYSTSTIHIILADGAQMSVEYNGKAAISLSKYHPLAIYGQSAGTGRLSVTSDCNAIAASGGITINGGIVSATSTGGGRSAIDAHNGAITINGGQVTATPGDNSKGITTAGTITLGLRSTSDFITANGYYGTVNIKDGQALKTPSGNIYYGTLTDAQKSAIANVTLQPATQAEFIAAALPQTAADTYTISDAAGWDAFCLALQDNDTYNRFSGKTVRLGGDIGTAQDPITRMAGSQYHDFCGTFDGQGYTLTVNISSDSRDYTAPFSYVSTTKADPNDQADSPAAIRNLNVAGTVTATKNYASALVGAFWGTLTIENCTSSVTINTNNKHAAGFISHVNGNATLRNCLSSVTINSTVSGDGTHAGFIGGSSNGVTINIEGCAFTGSMLGSTTTHCAGFMGYNSGTLTITNSLYAPADDETWVSSDGSATFARGNAPTTTNTYYTRALGTEQGKAAHTVTAGENVTVANAGNATEYNVSGITAYGTGIKYGSNLYAGSGDQVSLTLSNSSGDAPAGYQYGYSASAGTLDGTTLTMPDADVTITVGLSVIDWATESDGDADHPYMIYNKDQLDLLAQRVNNGTVAYDKVIEDDGAHFYYYYSDKYFKLMNDITYSHTTDWFSNYNSTENNYEAIGCYYSYDNYRVFNGHFDGNGKTIRGIRIYKGGSDDVDSYQGIFGITDSDAYIHDLTLADACITGYLSTGGIVGANVGGTITRCHVANNVAINSVKDASGHGGIVGYNNGGTVSHCTSAVKLYHELNSDYFLGGIAGANDGTLKDNLVIGATIPTNTSKAYGAITGGHESGTLEHNYYTACIVAGVSNTTGVGRCLFEHGTKFTIADVTEDDGAVPALRDGADNTYALSLFAAIPATLDLGRGAGKYSVQLTGRTLYKDGDWNTLCLPFDVSTTSGPLAGDDVVAMTLNTSESNLTGSKLTLNFDAVETIPAGTPFIIKWATKETPATDLVSPVFTGVTIDNTMNNADFTGGTFKGTYSPIVWDTENKSILFVGENNTLYYPKSGAFVNACRAYFDLGSASAREFVMNFDGENEVTSLPQPLQKEGSQADAWYTLDGRKLNGKPTTKGLYIHNGKKVIIK